MPSAYTEKLYKGDQDFKDFVLRTARGMGALIHMRDTGLDAEVTLPEVGDYHKNRLQEAQDALAAFESYTDEDWRDQRDEEHKAAMRAWFESQKTALARRERYDKMLDEVRYWIPPTPDHESFKQYMIDQLIESKKFDCSLWNKPKLKDLEEYKQDKISKALSDVSYHSEKHKEEIERVNERRKWIQALLDSLEEQYDG